MADTPSGFYKLPGGPEWRRICFATGGQYTRTGNAPDRWIVIHRLHDSFFSSEAMGGELVERPTLDEARSWMGNYGTYDEALGPKADFNKGLRDLMKQLPVRRDG